jgi:hypothetical protein
MDDATVVLHISTYIYSSKWSSGLPVVTQVRALGPIILSTAAAAYSIISITSSSTRRTISCCTITYAPWKEINSRCTSSSHSSHTTLLSLFFFFFFFADRSNTTILKHIYSTRSQSKIIIMRFVWTFTIVVAVCMMTNLFSCDGQSVLSSSRVSRGNN